MIENDNSVNIENEKGRYHHGDLRAALISEGLRLLAIGDVDQLSLRQIARNVGVSPTAVYRHFPDKQALLTALAMEGGAQLARRQKKAQTAAGGGRAGFDETGRVYVRFALENPALFRLMTAKSRVGTETCPGRRGEDAGSLAAT
ncbi:MAG: TetR/AcrR family transcriptional regulator [Sphingomonadales bacterium]|nr:TetR/AcrR family transcriptional regulator [Sphingomonadales bacterium]